MKKYLLIIMALVMLTPLMACESDDPLIDPTYDLGGYYYYTSNNTWVNVNDHHQEHENNGSDEIDVTDLSGHLADNQTPEAHSTNHEYGGPDEMNIKNLWMINSNVFMAPGGGSPSAFSVTQTAGRGTAYASVATLFAYTNSPSTANDVIGIACWASDYWLDYSLSRFRYRVSGRIASASTTNNMEMWVGHFASPTTFPTITSNHFGLRLIENAGAGDGNAILYASNGTGAAGTQTSIQTGYGQYDTFDYCIIYGASDIKYYGGFNGAELSLVATHTTNRPQFSTGNFGIWVKTFDTVQKWGQLYYPQVMPRIN